MTTLKPNPEYELCEHEMRWISNPAAKPIPALVSLKSNVPTIEMPMPLRWRSKDSEAVIKAWNEGRYDDMQKLCVPSHIPA